jgi:hypothetical protein
MRKREREREREKRERQRRERERERERNNVLKLVLCGCHISVKNFTLGGASLSANTSSIGNKPPDEMKSEKKRRKK